MRAAFPWSAVIGQERLKQALLLCAIDPAIGGVLVRGPRGVAKTTLARAFAELLPGSFVELPLGATEERVTGTLDLSRVLQAGEVQFSPGLLARAHEGVLYVDEVNLLSDALVDLLLDAAATGSNVVERDGVSHVHAARFVLVGTMNPEEGELRAQFVDRFGLSVSADGEIAPPERAQIVLSRLDFESDPQRFLASFEVEQRSLVERCARARQRALSLSFRGPGLARVAELCHAAGVEGVRADLAMLRAARAHAAWHERQEITVADVEAVAELALAHRRRPPPEPPRSGAPGSGTGNQSSPGASRSGAAPAAGTPPRSSAQAPSSVPEADPAPSAAAGSADRSSGDRGALAPVPVRASAPPELPAALRSLAPKPRTCALPAVAARSRKRGGLLAPALGPIDWFATLARCPRPTHADLRRRARSVRRESLWIVAIDCSSSMLQSGALALAKGAAQALVEAAAGARSRLALISFSGQRVRTEALADARAGSFDQRIGALAGGGGTPLAGALEEALALCQRASSRSPHVAKRLLLLTDGRTREQLEALGRRCAELEVFVLDCEAGPLRLGRARALATALGGRYLQVASFPRAPE
jgi:magnesium chelatase subunit D